MLSGAAPATPPLGPPPPDPKPERKAATKPVPLSKFAPMRRADAGGGEEAEVEEEKSTVEEVPQIRLGMSFNEWEGVKSKQEAAQVPVMAA